MFVKRNDLSYKKMCTFQVTNVQVKVILHYDSLFGDSTLVDCLGQLDESFFDKYKYKGITKVKVLLLYGTTKPDCLSSALQPYPWRGLTQPWCEPSP